jgi:hypothetical protein
MARSIWFSLMRGLRMSAVSKRAGSSSFSDDHDKTLVLLDPEFEVVQRFLMGGTEV